MTMKQRNILYSHKLLGEVWTRSSVNDCCDYLIPVAMNDVRSKNCQTLRIGLPVTT